MATYTPAALHIQLSMPSSVSYEKNLCLATMFTLFFPLPSESGRPCYEWVALDWIIILKNEPASKCICTGTTLAKAVYLDNCNGFAGEPSTSSVWLHCCHPSAMTKFYLTSGGSRILRRGVRIIRCAKSGKNFYLTTPTFSETTPIKSPVYLVRVRPCARTKSKLAVL